MDAVALGTCPLCSSAQLSRLPAPEHWIGGRTFARYRGALGLSRCRNCRFVFTNPRPPAASLTQFYSGVILPRQEGGVRRWDYPEVTQATVVTRDGVVTSDSRQGAAPPLLDAPSAKLKLLLGEITRHVPGGALLEYG